MCFVLHMEVGVGVYAGERAGLFVWLCACEGCVDQLCEIELSVLMEIFSICTV